MTQEQQQPQPTPTDTFAGLTRAQVAELRRTHGVERVKTLSAPTAAGQRLQVVVRAPSRDEYDRYVETLAKFKERTAQALSANRTLLMSCLLAPDAAAVAVALDAQPALVDKLVEPVLSMAGADAEVREETF
ncbi:hypothetical protein [Deinococcus wulumuqiensis]|uniref:Uncharacterized protein n=1 Tax=Deinococcus wulumuqiensis TaxID=980427 RepID=A0AAV4K9V4_9DEIO|nr:hypothetical protein [Deinococcus wulumuqiensis]QII20052.1 hypothetical protein G6R31_04200 [Deinococcus wulumuqiensis R12]GGI87250.1 hypothetical protein GCM10010914_22150 [Deinococcus wulumuqiensis]GGP29988.1 hypothetical protein GCM10008021_16390 [Deinococcus wulumuqiensis]